MKPFFSVDRNVVILAINFLYRLPIRRHKKRTSGMIITAHVARLMCLCLCLCLRLDATSIVAVWTPIQITIAADSKQTLTQNRQIVGSQPSCKMYPVHDLIVAFAGLVKSEEIDVIESIKNTHEFTQMGTGKKLPEVGPWIGAQDALQKILRARQANGLSDPSDLTASMIIAGRDGSKLFMYRVESGIGDPRVVADFGHTGAGFWNRRIAYPPEGKPSPKRGFETLGLDSAISRFRLALPTEWDAGTDVQVARRLVAIEASDTIESQFVGGPISTIVITKKRIQWKDKGLCEWEPAN